MQLTIDGHEEVPNGTTRVTPLDRTLPPTREPPPHHLVQHGGPRLMEVSGEVVHLLPRRGVQAGIQADAGGRLARWLIPRGVHVSPVNQAIL